MCTLGRLFLIWCLLLLEVVNAFSSATRYGSARTTIWLAATQTEQEQTIIPWLIVGGGPVGVHIAARLLSQQEDVTLVDDGPRLLHGWKERTAATGMSYLRSSASQHLDIPDDSLRRFGRRKDAFASDYQRPRLDVFHEHCDHVITQYGLADRHVRGRVVDVFVGDNVVRLQVQQQDGIVEMHARNIVLALGNADPVVPDWVTEDMRGRVRHLLDHENHPTNHTSSSLPRSIAIVGGGMSAAHLALQLEREARKHGVARQSSAIIHMVCRHALREQQFDTHQDWMMDAAAAARSVAGGGQGVPKRQRQFASLTDVAARRRVIQQERPGGTISAAVHRGKDGLRYAIEQERIRWCEGSIHSVSFDDDKMLRLSLSTGEDVVVEEVILATGFSRDPPGKHLVHTVAQRYGAKLSPCGYPIPDQQLRWHDRIFVAGALAELEIGPSARNIAGARIAAERIVSAASIEEGQNTLYRCSSSPQEIL